MNTQPSIQTDLILDCMVSLLFRSLLKSSLAYDVKDIAKFTKKGITYVQQTDFVSLLSSANLVQVILKMINSNWNFYT